MKHFTVGMAVKDDPSGLFYTLSSIDMTNNNDGLEIIVIDNSNGTTDDCELIAKRFGARVIREKNSHGTHVRNLIFEHATHDFVICMDSHITLSENALWQLFNSASINGPGIYHGALYDPYTNRYCHHIEPKWYCGFYGKPAFELKKRYELLPIEVGGLGLFGIQRSYWIPFIDVDGWGGEEGFHHERLARAGIPSYCVCTSVYVHAPSNLYTTARYDRANRLVNYEKQARAAEWTPERIQSIYEHV